MSIQDMIAALNQQSQLQQPVSGGTTMARASSANGGQQSAPVAPASTLQRTLTTTPPKRGSVASMRHRFDQSTTTSTGTNTATSSISHDQLQKQLDVVTRERDDLRARLSAMTDEADWAGLCDENEISDEECDYDEIIASYHRHASQKNMGQQRLIDDLTHQLSACERGTQWMVTRFVHDLEQERLQTKALKSLASNQQQLIQTMEDTLKLGQRASQPPLPPKEDPPLACKKGRETSFSASPSFYEQQYYLLNAQVELQRLELDDHQDMLAQITQERDQLLLRVSKHASMHHPPLSPTLMLMSPPASVVSSSSPSSPSAPLHPRTSSSSTDCSVQSYLSWSSFDDAKLPPFAAASHHGASTFALPRPYTPPQTPPPRDPLPQVPDLSQKSSMPDMRTMHHHHHYHHHHFAQNEKTEKKFSLKRQASFWKSVKQRLH
ncbi:hypothetical protein BC940DRAFT_349543 [Gongronella butleri]|nr:hypothetical protein BC940DRAFT_349543 [Gongronella butleri]